MTIEAGQAFVARLREAIAAAPAATRYVVQSASAPVVDSSLPLVGRVGVGVKDPGGGAGVVATPVSDTCKEVIDGLVRRTVPRDSLVTIVGPWIFTREALTEGLARVEGRERDITELVAFCQAARLKVRVLGA